MNTKQTIGVVIAMPEEAEVLLQLSQSKVILDHLPFAVQSMELDGSYDMVVVTCGIGKVNAACATAFLIERYGVSCLINVGVAGGVHEALRIGDLVWVESCLYYDVDATAFGYALGQLPQMPLCYPAIAFHAEWAKDYAYPVTQGLLCTGDQFLSDRQAISKMQASFPQVMAVDMEGTAVAQVCFRYQTPCLIIKAISDLVNQESKNDCPDHVHGSMRHAAQFILHCLPYLVNKSER